MYNFEEDKLNKERELAYKRDTIRYVRENQIRFLNKLEKLYKRWVTVTKISLIVFIISIIIRIYLFNFTNIDIDIIQWQKYLNIVLFLWLLWSFYKMCEMELAVSYATSDIKASENNK